MRIGLIAMSGVRVRNPELAKLGVTLPQFVSRGQVIASLPSLGLLTVAALTPPDCEVVYREIGEVTPDTALESVVFAATAADVREVIAGGRRLVSGGRHAEIDVPAELAAAIERVYA